MSCFFLRFGKSCVGLAPIYLLLLTASLAQGAGFTVNSTEDLPDINVGDAKCDVDPGLARVCTLRAAVQESYNLVDRQIIVPAGTYILSVAGTGEDLGATGDLDLQGVIEVIGVSPGNTIIDGGGIDRVFDLHAGSNAKFTLTNLTIRNGAAPKSEHGGGIRADCESSCPYDPALTVDNVSIYNNSATDGGGIYARYSDLTVIDSTVTGNTATSMGGGIKVSAGIFRLEASTVSWNSAGYHGGGLGVISIQQGTELVNSTISGNDSAAEGGGLYVSASGNTKLYNVTVTDNTADSDANGAALGHGGGGIASYTSNYISAANSLIAGNYNGRGYFADDCKNQLRSLGYNLIGVTTGCTISNYSGNPSSNDQTGVADPGLDALTWYGGPTFTHALLAGSPAIDAGNPAGCTDLAGAGLAFDQRGEDRAVDGDGNQSVICDVGAVESVPEPGMMALYTSALATLFGMASRRRVGCRAALERRTQAGHRCTRIASADEE